MDQHPIVNYLVNEYDEMEKTERISLVKIGFPNSEKNSEFMLHLLCLNCQNHVQVSDADMHSLICILPTESVRGLDKQTSVEQIKYKLFKLKDLFERTIREKENEGTQILGMRTMMELALKVCEQDQYYCDQVSFERLSVIIDRIDGDIWMKLLAERLYSLLAQLENLDEGLKGEKEEEEEGFSFQKQTLKFDSEIRELKKKVDVYKRRSLILQNACLKTQPSTFFSQSIESIESRMGSPQPTLVSLSPASCNSPEIHLPSYLDLGFNSETELRKYFYSLYLSQKLRLLSQKKHKIKNFSVNKLYTHALFKQIPPENWQSFIFEQLQNPDPDLKESPVRHIYNFRKKQNFESIIEEDSGPE